MARDIIMEKLTYTNANGETIVIQTKSAVYRLLSFKDAPVRDNAQTSKGYKQNGLTYEDAQLGPRDQAVSFLVFGNGLADLFEKRREIKRLLNPQLGEGTLVYENDYITKRITVKFDAEPVFSTDKKNFGFHSQICYFTTTSYNPYWRDLADTEIELVGLEDGFFWDDAVLEEPIYFEEETAFYMGEVSAASKIVINSGDVPAPLTIEWIGAATNPKITLEDTGEYILLAKVLGADEKLIITTAYGQKAVIIETISTGAQVKDFSIVDPGSTFFSIPVGNSTVSLSADSGAASAAVTIKYKNLLGGL